jgi:hypothetical protein
VKLYILIHDFWWLGSTNQDSQTFLLVVVVIVLLGQT